MVMATAVSTGLVGDSLTVLDRSDPRVRSALWRIGWIVVTGSAGLGFALTVTLGALPLQACVAFALAMAAFVTADLGRRLLMANLRFWSLVVVDGVGLGVGLGFLGLVALSRELELTHLLLAVTLTQVTAVAIAVTMLPGHERGRPRSGWGAWRAVLGFGSWRAAQQFVRPTMLNAARWVVLVAAGAAAVGELEAARIFVAPAMLLVQGFGSYLFSSYAADRDQGARVLLGRADRAASVMLGSAVVVGAGAALLLPVLGDLVTAGRFDLNVAAVLGWACYAASCAAVLPYGSLAAVRGQQQLVFLVRVADSLLSLGLVAALVLLAGLDFGWTPWLLSAGSFAGGLWCRQVLLRPSAFAEARS
jgi:O-antigen/teichoic acid export membrane protein